jgi:hypothetical protein
MDTNEMDHSQIMLKAENLKRDFSEPVLCQLSEIVLGAVFLLLVGWTRLREDRGRASMEGDAMSESVAIAGKVQRVNTFVTALSRWYKIPSKTRRLLQEMEEIMAI